LRVSPLLNMVDAEQISPKQFSAILISVAPITFQLTALSAFIRLPARRGSAGGGDSFPQSSSTRLKQGSHHEIQANRSPRFFIFYLHFQFRRYEPVQAAMLVLENFDSPLSNWTVLGSAALNTNWLYLTESTSGQVGNAVYNVPFSSSDYLDVQKQDNSVAFLKSIIYTDKSTFT